MAVGETSGQGRPRRLITAGGGRRRLDQGAPGSSTDGSPEEDKVVTVPPEPEADGAGEVPEIIEKPVPVETGEALVSQPEPSAPAEEVGATPGLVAENGESDAAKPVVSDLIQPPVVPDELERRLAEDEEMERRARQHHEAPHFRREVD